MRVQVELVCSPTNVVLYLFKLMKYILKGGDTNRVQIVLQQLSSIGVSTGQDP